MNLSGKCQECNEVTKFATGLWDGRNGTHGFLYDCRNEECAVKVMKMEAEKLAKELSEGAKKENWDNNIYPGNIKAAYRAKGMVLGDLGKLTGIPLPTLCDYIYERKALPVELYCKMMEQIAAAPVKGAAY